jgi:DNA-binding transcriptional MerR regulator
VDVLRIGELSTITGVSRSTLRMWERRYGLVVPTRLANGYRVYSPDDVARVLAMRRGLSRGVGAAEAAAAARVARADAAEASSYPAVAALADIRSAFEEWDAARGSRAVQRAVVTLGLGVALTDVLLPYLRDIGERWARGEIAVAQEHFASQAIRGVLIRLAAGWEEAPGPTALLACAPGEEHDIGLVCFGLVLRGFHGWRIAFLGGSTPLADVFKAAHALSPRAIVLSAVVPERFRDGRPSLTRLAARFRVALAGAGATSRLAGAVGAELLPGDPVTAAAVLAGARGA